MTTTTLPTGTAPKSGLNALFASASGLIFGLGLIASGMTSPLKVKAFLDLAGAWDPSLALVMGGAIAVAVGAYAAAKRRTHAWSGERIDMPASTVIDRKLLLGGALFGAGWGVAGLCPGPALVAASAGSGAAATLVAAMLVGMVLHDKFIQGPGARQ